MGAGAAAPDDPRSPIGPRAGKPVIAVFNSSDDTVELLRTFLEEQGFQTVAGHIPDLKKGELDLVTFIQHHAPSVIVYDISPPYDANWTFLRLVRSSEPVRNRRFVITTTNKPALDKLVGATEAIEIIGKPYDLRQLLAAIRSALASP
jgi:DNA-binding response OmpR family regulator